MADLSPSEQQEIDEAYKKEIQEIAECLMDIRRRSGYGVIVIVLKKGEIEEIDLTHKRRPRVEKKAQAG